MQDLKQQADALNEQRRVAEAQSAQLKAKGEAHRQEILQLSRENRELLQKTEGSDWIAKSEYERVTKLLHEKEKELARIIRESKG